METRNFLRVIVLRFLSPPFSPFPPTFFLGLDFATDKQTRKETVEKEEEEKEIPHPHSPEKKMIF